MADAAIEAVLRRDRVIVAAALVVLTALAWAYVCWLAADMDMGGMDMPGLSPLIPTPHKVLLFDEGHQPFGPRRP